MTTGVKSYLLFTTPTCVYCPPVKEFLSKKGTLEGAVIDATKSEGRVQAASFGVRSVPTVIFFDEQRQEVARANDVHAIRSLLTGQ